MSSAKEINFVNISVNSLVTDSATGDSHVSKESRQKRHWTVFYCIYMSTYLVQVNYFYLQYVIDFRKSLTCWLSELNDTNETTKHNVQCQNNARATTFPCLQIYTVYFFIHRAICSWVYIFIHIEICTYKCMGGNRILKTNQKHRYNIIRHNNRKSEDLLKENVIYIINN